MTDELLHQCSVVFSTVALLRCYQLVCDVGLSVSRLHLDSTSQILSGVQVRRVSWSIMLNNITVSKPVSGSFGKDSCINFKLINEHTYM